MKPRIFRNTAGYWVVSALTKPLAQVTYYEFHSWRAAKSALADLYRHSVVSWRRPELCHWQACTKPCLPNQDCCKQHQAYLENVQTANLLFKESLD